MSRPRSCLVASPLGAMQPQTAARGEVPRTEKTGTLRRSEEAEQGGTDGEQGLLVGNALDQLRLRHPSIVPSSRATRSVHPLAGQGRWTLRLPTGWQERTPSVKSAGCKAAVNRDRHRDARFPYPVPVPGSRTRCRTSGTAAGRRPHRRPAGSVPCRRVARSSRVSAAPLPPTRATATPCRRAGDPAARRGGARCSPVA